MESKNEITRAISANFYTRCRSQIAAKLSPGNHDKEKQQSSNTSRQKKKNENVSCNDTKGQFTSLKTFLKLKFRALALREGVVVELAKCHLKFRGFNIFFLTSGSWR